MSAQPAATAEYDPYNSADEAHLRPQTYFGQVQCSAWPCVLVKGTGKVAFNPQVHKVEDRVTAIDISLLPIAEQQVNFPLTRSLIAESTGWVKITKESFMALGLKSARELDGKWAKIEFAPTGRKYPKKDRQTGRPTGETSEETTFKFLAFYAGEASAKAAYLGGAQPAAEAVPGNFQPAPANATERATALAFLKAMLPRWTPNGQDVTAVEKGIRDNAVIARHFNVTSPEVIDLMVAQATK